MAKRKLLYVPHINPHTFLFFYSKGESGRSYSFRDYSRDGSPILTYAAAYPYTDHEILSMARYCFDAEPHDTHDLAYWHAQIEQMNGRYLKRVLSEGAALSPTGPTTVRQSAPGGALVPQYPVLDLELLRNHPVKGAKGRDMERILTSRHSEDYVTWNMLRLILKSGVPGWWPLFLRLVQRKNPSFHPLGMENDVPVLEAWRKYPTPIQYEKLSRERMAKCQIPELVSRSKNPVPVEGESEIDLVITGKTYLIFVEAKLGSDISMSTTYDPARNQMIRNVDVLLEQCGSRTPFFMMFVKDSGPGRAYVQLAKRYQKDPLALAKDLPHREPAALEQLAKNISLVSWADLLELLDLGEGSAVVAELRRRISIPADRSGNPENPV